MNAPILAAFVWPSLFIGGAIAVIAPILIHLLARRRFKRIRWAAIEFLLQAEKRNRRRVRLEELILLLLRCLAVLLIAALIARPFIRPEGLAALLGGADRTERIFLLDDSMSMGYQSEGGTSFERSQKAVIQLVKLLREQSPHDTVTLLKTSNPSTPVAAGVFLDDRQTEDLFARIEALLPSEQSFDSRDLMDTVRKLLDEQPQTVSASIYVVSDFQKKDWVDQTPDASTGGPQAAQRSSAIATLADWSTQDRGLKLALVDVGDDDASNVAVTGLDSDRSRWVIGVRNTARATLANFADDNRSLNLDVTIGSVGHSGVEVPPLGPRESTAVNVPVTLLRPGWQWVRVQTPPDALPADDHRTVVLQGVESVRVLLVNGEPSTDTYRNETFLLETAIRPPGEIFSGNELLVIDETELEGADLRSFDAVILANVYRVTDVAASALAAYVREGGGLAFFLGDQVDAEFYNQSLYDDGRGLLPAKLNERRTAPTAGAHLVIDDELHPIVKIFGGAENPFTNRILFSQYYATQFESAADVEDAADQRPGERARIIAHYTDDDRSAAIVERPWGDGRVILFTSSCDMEWNDWGKDPSYVVSMLELAHHLGKGAGRQSDQWVGTPIDLAIDPAEFTTDIRVRTPGYPAEAEVPLTALADDSGRGFRAHWTRTQSSGVYQFVLTRRSGEEEIQSVAVNVDPRESDLTPATEADLRQSLHEIPLTYIDGLGSLEQVGEEARRELWRTVLAAALIVLMGEQFLAFLFGRRG